MVHICFFLSVLNKKQTYCTYVRRYKEFQAQHDSHFTTAVKI